MGVNQAASSGRGVRRAAVLAAIAVAVVIVPAVASAITITIDLGGAVNKDVCSPCHANIADTDSEKYLFSHGKHIVFACRSCHPAFPHTPAGTETPPMERCWACHGLEHGPQGSMAAGACEHCHGTGPVDLRPQSHTADWALEPHVKPSEERLQTECAMCHTFAECDRCHRAERIDWVPAQPFTYDPGNECMACHGDPSLSKASIAGTKSFFVRGIDRSAHSELGCIECHVDFGYQTRTAPTRLWRVNAGLACAECHARPDVVAELGEQTAEWQASIHGRAIAEGNLDSATCGGCHGGHDIARLDTDAALRALQASGERTCGSCHADYYASYDDWYHGAAYKRGVADAPACWECHGAHNTLASDDPSSTVYPANIGNTCASCHQHKGATESFAEQTAGMIHGRPEIRANNLLLKLVARITGGTP